MKRLLIGLLLRLLNSSLKLQIDYKQIDKKAVEEWGFRSFDDKGWRSYFAYEDMKILRELSFGKDRDQYFVLIGRRLQLLYIFDEMKKSFANRKSAEEKRKAETVKESQP